MCNTWPKASRKHKPCFNRILNILEEDSSTKINPSAIGTGTGETKGTLTQRTGLGNSQAISAHIAWTHSPWPCILSGLKTHSRIRFYGRSTWGATAILWAPLLGSWLGLFMDSMPKLSVCTVKCKILLSKEWKFS